MNAVTKHVTIEDISAQIEDLAVTAQRIKQERDELKAALEDISMGAFLMLEAYPSADLQRYATEVRRVAQAALGR